MSTSAGQDHTLEYRRPGESQWRSLKPADESEGAPGDAEQNKKDLHNTLLTSLQMQHLVVLAGSGCSLAAGGPSMRHLWESAVGKTPKEEAQSVSRTVDYDLQDKNIEAFLSHIEAFLYVNSKDEVAKFLTASKEVILKQCSEFLETDKLDAHKVFLHRLARRRTRDERLKVFTTNYDLCFERAASELGGVALDGFSFSAPRHYDPRFFDYDIIRRPRGGDDSGNYVEGVFLLYKLHGSVNWSRNEKGAIVEREKPDPENACLIYPARGKYQQSFTQPHLESMARYLAAIREPNTCIVVVGFGFNDDHLAEPLLAAAQSNPHLRQIIADPGVKSMVNEPDGYFQKLSELSNRNEDIWFIAAYFAEFAELIPNLKTLTPADALAKNIQEVIKEG